MLDRLLPQCIDNHYRGYKVGLWLFGLLLFVKIAMSLNSIFNGYTVATTADGIPLDTFTPAGSQTVVYLFASWGLAHLIISLLCVLVLARYRSMVPLMFALLSLEVLGRKLIHYFLPTVRIGTPPAAFINPSLLALMFIGLGLSLRIPGKRLVQE